MGTDPIMPERNDNVIINQVLAGDTQGFSELVLRYRDFVFAIVLKHCPAQDAEEISQQTFLEAFRSLNRLSNPSVFRSWLARITYANCIDYWKRNEKHRFTGHLEDEKSALALERLCANNFQLEQSQESNVDMLNFVLSKLGAAERIALSLVYFEDMTVKQAAEQLGCSTIALKVRLFRARQKLAKLLRRNHVDA